MQIKPDDAAFWLRLADVMPEWHVVADAGGEAVPFHPRSAQRLLLNALVYCMANNKDLLHCKARKHGASTLFAWFFHLLLTYRRNMHVAIIANKNDVAEDIAGKMNMFHLHTPEYMLPYRAPRDAKLKTMLRILHPTQRRGEFEPSWTTLLSVLEREPGRGMTFQGVHASEIGKWSGPFAEDTWASVRNARAKERGILVAEGTPSHYMDPLHKEWQLADTLEGSRWHRLFLPWFAILEYQLEPPPGWAPRSDVRAYADVHALSARQTYYLEKMILPDCGTWDKVETEYPSSIQRCWKRTGYTLFDAAVLEEREEFLSRGGVELRAPLDDQPNIELYADANPDHCYVITCDPAASDGDRDYFCAEVLDVTVCTQAAEVWIHAHAGMVAAMLLQLSTRFNYAMMAIEANGVGNGLISHIPPSEHWRLFRHNEGNPLDLARTGFGGLHLGWWSNAAAKAAGFAELQQLIAGRTLLLNSVRAIRELLEYRGERKRARDAAGGHFDRLSALLIGAWMLTQGRAVVLQHHERVRTMGLLRPVVVEGGSSILLPSQLPMGLPELVYLKPRGVRTPWGVHR